MRYQGQDSAGGQKEEHEYQLAHHFCSHSNALPLLPVMRLEYHVSINPPKKTKQKPFKKSRIELVPFAFAFPPSAQSEYVRRPY